MRKNTKSISKAIVKYLLVLILTVSLLIAYFNSYLIPSLFWVNQVQAYVSQNQGNFRNQLSGLHPNLLDIFAKIIPKTEANIAEMYTTSLMQSISQYGSIVEAYSKAEPNYLDELFKKGINISKYANINTKRILYLQNKNLMHNILANFQMSKEGVREILQTVGENGKLTVIRPAAFGVYVREVYRVIRVPLFNRIYEARWTCKSIGILLLVALICLIFVNEAEKTIGPQYKQITQNQQKVQSELQLFTNDNVH